MEWFLHNQAHNNKEIMDHKEIGVHKDNSKEDGDHNIHHLREIMVHKEIMGHKDHKQDMALDTNKEVIVNKVHNIKEDMAKDHNKEIGANLKVAGVQDNKMLGVPNNLHSHKEHLQKSHQDQKSQLNYLLQKKFNVLNSINLKKWKQ